MTGIEWTDRTWNPIAGCSVLTPGCTNCYAMRMADRIQRMGGKGADKYAGTTRGSKAGPVWTGQVNIDDAALLAPLRWKKPARIFVNSMSDLFHESVPDEWIDRIFAVMALCPQHTFQVLSKRADRMRRYLTDLERRHTQDGNMLLSPRVSIFATFMTHDSARGVDMSDQVDALVGPWPLPNIWLGVSVEDQRRADERIPLLLQTPAALRWISAEPLLGPVDLKMIHHDGLTNIDALAGRQGLALSGDCARLDWVVAGGESGPNARPVHPDWIRSLRDQCGAAGVPFFFKQWGAWYPRIDRDTEDPDWRENYTVNRNRRILNLAGGCGFHGDRVHLMARRSKRSCGNQIDGRQHLEWPR